MHLVCVILRLGLYLVWNWGATLCLKAWCSAPSGPWGAYCGPFDAIIVCNLRYKNNLLEHHAITKLTSLQPGPGTWYW